MKKIILATATAATLSLGLGAASADEPGVDKYFHERGNLDASLAQKGPAPDLAGWSQERYYGGMAYGYAPEYGYSDPMGYAPRSGFGNW